MNSLLGRRKMSKMSDLNIDRQQREAEEEYMQSEQYRKEHDAQSVKEALDKAFDKKQREILDKLIDNFIEKDLKSVKWTSTKGRGIEERPDA